MGIDHLQDIFPKISFFKKSFNSGQIQSTFCVRNVKELEKIECDS